MGEQRIVSDILISFPGIQTCLYRRNVRLAGYKDLVSGVRLE